MSCCRGLTLRAEPSGCRPRVQVAISLSAAAVWKMLRPKRIPAKGFPQHPTVIGQAGIRRPQHWRKVNCLGNECRAISCPGRLSLGLHHAIQALAQPEGHKGRRARQKVLLPAGP